uniref:NIMA related kinase 11 n=1 Tax=Ovis aries TaxID=9940 RepID=A0AC11AQR9_SHEEP
MRLGVSISKQTVLSFGAMLKFQEAAKCVSGSIAVSTCPKSLIARRYMLQQKLGSGSFGTVYLVSDKKAKQGEELVETWTVKFKNIKKLEKPFQRVR